MPGRDVVQLYYGDSRPALIHLAADTAAAPKFGLDEAGVEKAYADARPGRMDPDIYRHTRGVLHAGVDRVYGSPKYTDPDFMRAYMLKENLSQFSAFKTAEQSTRLAAAADLDEAHIINRAYNVNYLRTEYVHSVRGSRAAKNWGRIQRDKDLYPNLRYEASTAAEPRSDHKRLYGIVRPVDDDFWQVWFPPNDWGCKCGYSQVRGRDKGSAMPRGMKQPPPVMRNNPGISGKLIPYTHPIIQRAKNRSEIREQGGKLERTNSRSTLYEKAKEALIDKSFVSADGTEIYISDKGIEKILSQGSAHDIARNDMIIQLPAILRKMEYTRDGYIGNKRERNISRVLIYEAATVLGDLRITVFETDKKRILHGMYLKK